MFTLNMLIIHFKRQCTQHAIVSSTMYAPRRGAISRKSSHARRVLGEDKACVVASQGRGTVLMPLCRSLARPSPLLSTRTKGCTHTERRNTHHRLNRPLHIQSVRTLYQVTTTSELHTISAQAQLYKIQALLRMLSTGYPPSNARHKRL